MVELVAAEWTTFGHRPRRVTVARR
jgi:hypothetical protein